MTTRKATMTVDFNNLRRRALRSHDQLIERLNAAIIRNHDQFAHPNDIHHKQDVDLFGYVCIDAEDIEEILNDLRMLIGAVAMCHEERYKQMDRNSEQPRDVGDGGK